MRVSVIIPTLNEAPVVARAVTSAWRAGADEIIVGDGGSGDTTREIARQLGAHVVQTSPGRGGQQNAAALAANGEWLLFLHADNWLAPEAIKQLRASAGRPCLAGAFQQQIEAGGVLFRCLEWGNAFRARWLRLPYGDQAIWVQRRLLRELGGFPDSPLMEDILLMRRLRRHTRLKLLPGPVHVDPRRWHRHGVIRQTMRNWLLLTLFRLGVPPHQLARRYRRHDQPSSPPGAGGRLTGQEAPEKSPGAPRP